MAKSTSETELRKSPGSDTRSRTSGCCSMYWFRNSLEQRDARKPSIRPRPYQRANTGDLYSVAEEDFVQPLKDKLEQPFGESDSPFKTDVSAGNLPQQLIDWTAVNIDAE